MKAALLCVALFAPALSQAMCVATAETLIKIEIYTCQYLELRASASKFPKHPPHARGSKLRGSLVTGLVVYSTQVWSGTEDMAPYIQAPLRPIAKDDHVMLMVPDNAAKLCPAIISRQQTLVTKTPCCDVLPASGLCLVPHQMRIGVMETNPRKWRRWYPARDK